ncbi:hypothetical protein HHL16_06870 [Pseudoflavitalea sp. G-6-1-2]|uniref:DUF6263 family protein n=1 Tax=Pseudoflavitalea sp. G-6-1-2 TaxID=2728841 RepID=UPI00146EF3CD|nr:DUF6263 family protein [Pseudoflavitalea sp. G-6-1-2]NML20588.1 hypothetical protein [Pseudoflavitalea sp. G-6-1-2]
MKHLIAIAAVLITGAASAQTITKKVVFQKDQQLETQSSMKMNMTMEMGGMSMEMVNSYQFTNQITVTDVTPAEIKLSQKASHIVADVQAGPQSASYDSQKPADSTSQLAEVFGKKIKTTYHLTVDKNGKITASDDTDAAKAADAITSITGSVGESMSLVGTNLEIIAALPAGKKLKAGDTWTDSLIDAKANSRFLMNYKVLAIQGNEAQIGFGGTLDRAGEIQQQGMTLNMTIKGLLKGEYSFDTATGLIKTKKTNMDGDGKIEMAGQEIPFKMKVDSDLTLSRK